MAKYLSDVKVTNLITPFIKDTNGTIRITLATASPHLTFSGFTQINTPDSTAGTALNITTTGTVSGSWLGINISPTMTISSGQQVGIQVNPSVSLNASNTIVVGVLGQAVGTGASGTTGLSLYGLQFAGIGQTASGATATFNIIYGISVTAKTTVVGATGVLNATNVIGIYIQVASQRISTGSITVTDAAGIRIDAASELAPVTYTNFYGLHIVSQTSTNITTTNMYGIRIENMTRGTNIYLLEVGPTTPYFRVRGNFTAAANQTPVYISEGATPTLRQLRTKAGNTLGANDLVCVLV